MSNDDVRHLATTALLLLERRLRYLQIRQFMLSRIAMPTLLWREIESGIISYRSDIRPTLQETWFYQQGKRGVYQDWSFVRILLLLVDVADTWPLAEAGDKA
jgi:hypothetical protein